MKKSRFLSLLLVFVMLLTCSVNTTTDVFAVSDNPTITVGTAEGNPNDEVAITVSLSNNPGVCSIRMAVSYDSKLTLTAVTNGSIMSDNVFGKQLSANPYYVTWDESLANNDNTKNGTLVTLTFKIDESATAGDLPVSVSYRSGEIYNLDLDDVDFTIVNGKVTVKSASVPDPVPVTSIELDKRETDFNKGTTLQLNATVLPENATDKTLTWESADESIATVDANGLVTGVKNGTTTITAKSNNGTVQATCTVTINCIHDSETEIRNAKEATCCGTGYTGDTYCKDCNTKIASGSVIPATGHHVDADGKWESNGTQHWHTCYYGTQFDVASHTGGTATCTKKAKWSVCGAEYGDYAEHQLMHHDRIEPDYENDGNIEYWTCDECGKYFSDAEGNNEISADDIIIAKLTIAEYQFLDGEVIIEAPEGAIPEGSLFDVQKIVPPPAEVVEKVNEQMGSSSEVLAYYEIRLSDTDGELIIHLDGEITIKIQMPAQYVGSSCVRILPEDETGKLIVIESWWEGEYLCFKTDWLEIYD